MVNFTHVLQAAFATEDPKCAKKTDHLTKAMRNWKISCKAFSKRLQKLTIITKRFIAIIIEKQKYSWLNDDNETITQERRVLHLTVYFVLSGPAGVKAARKTLMKLTHGMKVNSFT